MKYSAKEFIRRRVINMAVIITISFLLAIAYLGLHKVDVEPVEKVQEITINVAN